MDLRVSQKEAWTCYRGSLSHGTVGRSRCERQNSRQWGFGDCENTLLPEGQASVTNDREEGLTGILFRSLSLPRLPWDASRLPGAPLLRTSDATLEDRNTTLELIYWLSST
jgi:hypothetical protein